MGERILETRYFREFLSSKLNWLCFLVSGVPDFCMHCLQNISPENTRYGHQ